MSPAGTRLLVTGTSGSGKTTYASGVLERLVARGYQVCVVDPEGDFERFPGLTPLGSAERAPSVAEVVALLGDARVSPAVSLLGLPLRDRPRFLMSFWPQLQDLRARLGRPHWLVLDEAHHMLSRAFDATALPREPGSLLLVTVHPERVSADVLGAVTIAVGIGDGAEAKLAAFLRGAGSQAAPRAERRRPDVAALHWSARTREVVPFEPAAPEAVHRRHRRKYASGDVADKAFQFRGPEGRLNLRAQNLQLFVQIADGIDDETWSVHLGQGDYSRWFREAIKDEGLARAAAEVEAKGGDPRQTRAHIRDAIEDRYILDEPDAAGG
jgi:hypothetical protein